MMTLRDRSNVLRIWRTQSCVVRRSTVQAASFRPRVPITVCGSPYGNLDVRIVSERQLREFAERFPISESEKPVAELERQS